ncbi:MAG: hypothetical protein ACLVKO_11370 [Dysgonomonas sp.]
MRTFLLVCIFISLPFLCEAQFMGVGGQYSQKSDGQFFVDVSYPVFKNKNPLNIFISSGVDYTTYGGAKLSGLNIKPIRINTFFSEDFF